jgi:hypothetical protein
LILHRLPYYFLDWFSQLQPRHIFGIFLEFRVRNFIEIGHGKWYNIYTNLVCKEVVDKHEKY